MARKTYAELLEEIEQLEQGMGYWNNLSNDFEEDGMRFQAQIKELEEKSDGFESNAWELRRLIEDAESLEDLKEELSNQPWL